MRTTCGGWTPIERNDSAASVSMSIASISGNSTITVADVRTGHVVAVLTDHTRGVTNVAYSPDGRYLAKLYRMIDLAKTTGHGADVARRALCPSRKLAWFSAAPPVRVQKDMRRGLE